MLWVGTDIYMASKKSLRINTNQINLSDWVNDMNVKNPIISVVDRKLCINEIIFEHDQLRESKQYLQSLGYSEVIFYPANDEDLKELEDVMAIMSEKNQEASGNEIPSVCMIKVIAPPWAEHPKQ